MIKLKCIKFPSIEQFRNVVSSVNRTYSFVGLDENGDAIYDSTKTKPTITFKGTVKLHGTNAAISYNKDSGIYTQSRNNAFPLSDIDSHMGFTYFVKSNEEYWLKEFNDYINLYNINPETHTITIFGEWAGKNIQKGVAISNIDKSFFVFGLKVSDINNEEKSVWYEYGSTTNPSIGVYNINSFPTYEIAIDFNRPDLSQNQLIEITNKVEAECPVAKAFKHVGVGEGVVWTSTDPNYRLMFKVKGELHSVSKVKTLAPIDVEKLNSVYDFVEYAMTRQRYEQGLSEVFGNDPLNYDVKKTGDLLRWLVNDILKEEIDTLKENKLEPKDVTKEISTKARKMFFKTLEIH